MVESQLCKLRGTSIFHFSDHHGVGSGRVGSGLEVFEIHRSVRARTCSKFNSRVGSKGVEVSHGSVRAERDVC